MQDSFRDRLALPYVEKLGRVRSCFNGKVPLSADFAQNAEKSRRNQLPSALKIFILLFFAAFESEDAQHQTGDRNNGTDDAQNHAGNAQTFHGISSFL